MESTESEKKQKINFNVIKAVAKVSGKLVSSCLKFKKTKEFSANIERLNAYFGTTDRETYILCSMISFYFDNNGSNCNFNDLSMFFNCPVMDVITFKSEVELLLKKDYIKNTAGTDSKKVSLKNEFELSFNQSSLEIVN